MSNFANRSATCAMILIRTCLSLSLIFNKIPILYFIHFR
jgi:hypothetical protein